MSRLSRISSNTKYYLKEGFGSIFVHGFLSVAAIVVIAACLLVTATFGLVAYNLDLLIGDMEKQSEIMVFIDENMTREQVLAFKSRLEAVDNIESVIFISKEQLFDDYLEQLGDDAYVMEELREDNPLRDGYRLVMRDISLHAQTVAALEKLPEIASTNSQKEVSDRLIQIRRIVNAISYLLIGMLGAVSVFIISNTVKLAMFARRDEVAVMRMVGATNHFIRMPFFIEGVVLGILAAGVAFLMTWGVYSYVTRGLLEGSAILAMVPFETVRLPLGGVLLGAGVLFGVGGSLLSLRRFLKV